MLIPAAFAGGAGQNCAESRGAQREEKRGVPGFQVPVVKPFRKR